MGMWFPPSQHRETSISFHSISFDFNAHGRSGWRSFTILQGKCSTKTPTPILPASNPPPTKYPTITLLYLTPTYLAH